MGEDLKYRSDVCPGCQDIVRQLELQNGEMMKLLKRAEDALGPDRTATDRKLTLMEIGKHLTEKPKRDQNCIDCGKPVTSGNICVPCIQVRYPDTKKREGLTVHGDIEPGLRCSASGCDELATCKECFGCKAHCDDLKART